MLRICPLLPCVLLLVFTSFCLSFFQVLKISLLGHRKRIIASLAERPYEEPPVKPPRLSQIRVRNLYFTLYNFIPTFCQAKHETT